LPVIANSGETICVSLYGHNNAESVKFAYRGKKYYVSGLHLTIAGDMVIFKTTENNQTYAIIPGAEINGYVASKMIYSSELTPAGKSFIAGKVIEEINVWYRANKVAVLAGLKEEAARRNKEEIEGIKAEIAKLEEKKAELEAKLKELE